VLLHLLERAGNCCLHGVDDQVANRAAIKIGDMVEDAGVDLRAHLDILEGIRIVAERLEDIVEISHRPGDSEVERIVLPQLGRGVDDAHHLVVVAVLVEEDLIIRLRTAAVLALNIDRGLEHFSYLEDACHL